MGEHFKYIGLSIIERFASKVRLKMDSQQK